MNTGNLAAEALASAGLRVSALEQFSNVFNVDNVFRAAERQATSIASKISTPATYQSLVEQITSARVDSLATTNSSIKELYDASVAELSKDIFSALSKNTSTETDDNSEPSQLLIDSALTVVSDFIDTDSANDSYFTDSVIDADFFLKLELM